MCVNNLPKVATQWNSGATRDSNHGRLVLIPSAQTTRPLSHTSTAQTFSTNLRKLVLLVKKRSIDSNVCSNVNTNVRSSVSHTAHMAVPISISLAFSQTPAYTATPKIRASASHGVPVCITAFTGTHCAYPRRDGQAELTLVAGYTLRWFIHLSMVTHPTTNQAGIE